METTQKNALNPVLEKASANLDVATATEIIVAFALPFLAWLLSVRFSNWFQRLPRTTWRVRIANFVVPLTTPVLSLLFIGIGLAVLKGLDIPPVLLPFMIKVLLAWLAMRVVILISSREIAGWFIALVIIPVTALHILGLWEPLAMLMQDVRFRLGTIDLNLYLVLKGLAAIVALLWVAGFLTRTTDKSLRRMRHLHASNRALVLKIFQIILYFVVLIVGLQALGIDITALSFFGGALGVAIGFGLQKTASNFVSGLILLFEKSVETGDVLELADGTMGIVRHTSARYTLLEMIDGKEILIPNEEFINQRVTNWTHSHSRARADIVVRVTFGTNIEKARELMLEAAKTHPKCLGNPAPMCVVTQFPEGTVELTLYFWIADMVDGRIEPKSDVSIAIWKAFRAHKIEVAPPLRLLREGK